MTIDEFLDRLAQTPHDWLLDRWYQIRGYHDGDLYCPLEAIAGRGRVVSALGGSIGLSSGDAWRIAITADGAATSKQFDEALRERLLAATVNR